MLQERNPALAERILTLRELIGGRGDFDDPVGGAVEVYRHAAMEISAIIEQAFPKIVGTIDSLK
ncbi:MAG: hypothetical protein MUO58_05280 [Anaerolineales bacterium]|nr:hypothetical protein [Anaerolineales bacterium]